MEIFTLIAKRHSTGKNSLRLKPFAIKVSLQKKDNKVVDYCNESQSTGKDS